MTQARGARGECRRGGAQGGIAGIRVPEVCAPGGGCEGRVCGQQGALGAGCPRRVLQQESAGRDRGKRGAPERAQCAGRVAEEQGALAG